MGCAQSSAKVTPLMNHIPIERLYGNDDYSLAQVPPVMTIKTSPTPVFVRSALKKVPSDYKRKANGPSLSNQRLPPIHKTVNFDEQVLVKARTPTPNKVWYEKVSSTMPMRKRPRNDDDDYDYEDEDEEELSSDDQEEGAENNQSAMTTPRPPTPLRRRNHPSVDTIGSMPLANTNYGEDPFSTAQQPYAADTSAIPSPNVIKVRRRLSQLGPPQIVPAPSYQPPLQSSTNLPYPSSVLRPTLSSYQSPLQPTSPVFHVQRIVPRTNAFLPEIRPPLTNSQSVLPTAYYATNHPSVENIT